MPSNQHDIREVAIARAMDAKARAQRASKKIRADSCDPEKLHLIATKVPGGLNRVKSKKTDHAKPGQPPRFLILGDALQFPGENLAGKSRRSLIDDMLDKITPDDKEKQAQLRKYLESAAQQFRTEFPEMDPRNESNLIVFLEQLLSNDASSDAPMDMGTEKAELCAPVSSKDLARHTPQRFVSGVGETWASPSTPFRAAPSSRSVSTQPVMYVGSGVREDTAAPLAHFSPPAGVTAGRYGTDSQVQSFAEQIESAVSSGNSTPRSVAMSEDAESPWPPSVHINIKRPARARPTTPLPYRARPASPRPPERARPSSSSASRVRDRSAGGSKQSSSCESPEQAVEIADQCWSSQASHRGHQTLDKAALRVSSWTDHQTGMREVSASRKGKQYAQRGVREAASGARVSKAIITPKKQVSSMKRPGSSSRPASSPWNWLSPIGCDDASSSMSLLTPFVTPQVLRLQEEEDTIPPMVCRRLNCSENAMGGIPAPWRGTPDVNVAADDNSEKPGALAKKHSGVRLSRKVMSASASSSTCAEEMQAGILGVGDQKRPTSAAVARCGDDSRASIQQSQPTSYTGLVNLLRSPTPHHGKSVDFIMGRALNPHSMPSAAGPHDYFFGVDSRSASATRGAPTELGEALSTVGQLSPLPRPSSSPGVRGCNSLRGHHAPPGNARKK